MGQKKHLVVKPGGRLPFKGIKVQVLTADGEHITSPLAGANQPNPFCASHPEAAADLTENTHSLRILVTHGQFRFIDLGDLPTKKERELAPPKNLIGTPDLALNTHPELLDTNAK